MLGGSAAQVRVLLLNVFPSFDDRLEELDTVNIGINSFLWESPFRTTEQVLAYVDDVGHPNIGLHLDTFHMHSKERDSAEAIRCAGDRLFHFHARANDRGVPGLGQVNWTTVAAAEQRL